MPKLISHDHAKFCIVMQNGPKSCYCCCCSTNFVQPCEIDSLRAKWLSLCNMIILLLNSILLNGEGSERPFKWWQVSTWPWHINTNLNLSLKNFLNTINYRIFYILYLNRILYFPSFFVIFSLAKHALWDQISKHEWLNLIFFFWRKDNLKAKYMVN